MVNISTKRVCVSFLNLILSTPQKTINNRAVQNVHWQHKHAGVTVPIFYLTKFYGSPLSDNN